MESNNENWADNSVVGGSTYLFGVGICSPSTASRVELNKTAENRSGWVQVASGATTENRADVQPGYNHIFFIDGSVDAEYTMEHTNGSMQDSINTDP